MERPTSRVGIQALFAFSRHCTCSAVGMLRSAMSDLSRVERTCLTLSSEDEGRVATKGLVTVTLAWEEPRSHEVIYTMSSVWRRRPTSWCCM